MPCKRTVVPCLNSFLSIFSLSKKCIYFIIVPGAILLVRISLFFAATPNIVQVDFSYELCTKIHAFR